MLNNIKGDYLMIGFVLKEIMLVPTVATKYPDSSENTVGLHFPMCDPQLHWPTSQGQNPVYLRGTWLINLLCALFSSLNHSDMKVDRPETGSIESKDRGPVYFSGHTVCARNTLLFCKITKMQEIVRK